MSIDVELNKNIAEFAKVVTFPDKKTKRYFNETTFIPKRLADEISDELPIFNDGIHLYTYENGVYGLGGEMKIRQLAQKKLVEESRKNRIKEVIYYLESNRLVDPDELNKDDVYINVKNGLLNWKTGELIPHTPKHLSTIQIPVKYDPKAKCPKFDEFLKAVVPIDTISMVHEMMGYLLIPKTDLEKAFMLTGTGANGKSTLLFAIEKLIGQANISNVPLQELEANRFKKALLYGKLANIFADLSSRVMEGSSAFKTLVSGDRIDGEFKGKDSFSFTPFAKLIFSANELPSSTELGEAFFRRWEIIDFPNQFKGSDRKQGLKYEITTDEEMSGILNHAIAGLNRISEIGKFSSSESSIKRKEQYEREADNVLAFVDEECIISPNSQVFTKQLYDAYKEWCFDNGYKALGKKKFNNRLTAKYPEINKKRDYGMSEHWQGIGIVGTELKNENGGSGLI
jgi:putative DNA primase/helicase